MGESFLHVNCTSHGEFVFGERMAAFERGEPIFYHQFFCLTVLLVHNLVHLLHFIEHDPRYNLSIDLLF
jgi:hypothetical protein